MIDFSQLVLVPNMTTFGRAVRIDPVKSQPGALPYAARGIFSSRDVDVVLDDGAVISSQETTLGIRMMEFPTMPVRGDIVTLDDGTVYWIAEVNLDGQGGAKFILRREE